MSGITFGFIFFAKGFGPEGVTGVIGSVVVSLSDVELVDLSSVVVEPEPDPDVVPVAVPVESGLLAVFSPLLSFDDVSDPAVDGVA